MQISAENILESDVFQICVKISEINSELTRLLELKDKLTKELKKKDELTFYKYTNLKLSEQSQFIEINKIAVKEINKPTA